MTDIDTNARNERLKLWIDALRSGNYGQTTGYLQDNTGYCCLGVACEVYKEATGLGHWIMHAGSGLFRTENSQGHVALPEDVAKWFGIGTNADLVDSLTINGSSYVSLIGLNDDAGFSFEDIANYIEKNSENIEIYDEETENDI